METRIKVAAAQMEPRILDKARNTERCLDLLRAAAGEGARLVVFPECALTGYCFTSRSEAEPVMDTVPGEATERLGETCAHLGVYAVVGLLERHGEQRYNSAVLVGPEGLIGSYRKVHLPYLGIDRFLDPGDRPFQVLETAAGRIGLNICYDTLFPEPARVLTLLGADIIVLPTNWPRGRGRVPQHIVPARAIENRVHYVATDRVGVERGVTFIGTSKIVEATGETLAVGTPDQEEILYAELDLTLARQKRVVMTPGEFEYDTVADRRPGFYGELCR